MSGSPSVIVPTLDGERLGRLLESLDGGDHQTVVVDNGSAGDSVAAACRAHGAEHVRSDRNLGYSAGVNLGVARADGDVVVLLNDDCVCDPGFVERISAPIDAAAGVGMVAGVMRDWADPGRVDSAGMELDQTLLVFDYLNGEPLSALAEASDPIGPSAAAAAFDREAFVAIGGFDERLFAYWEDVDLVLRMRAAGHRTVLARDAQGVHEHSATLGSGSARKNYLMGFGRAYVLRKWRALGLRTALPLLAREAVICGGQLAFDRNAAGIRGRVAGYRAARASERFPVELLQREGSRRSALETLRDRARRRARLSQRPEPADRRRAMVVFHIADTSGPSRSLESELGWLASEGGLDVVLPGRGSVVDALPADTVVFIRQYEALTSPSRGSGGPIKQGVRLLADVRDFRSLIAARRPELIVAVTAMVPAVSIAARLERVPLLVYCGEFFDRGYGIGLVRAFAGRQLAALTGRLASALIACSELVARQFDRLPPGRVEVVYPPHDPRRYGDGDRDRFRAAHGIPANAPVLASVGYVTEGRGQDVLIRALPEVLAEFEDARYVLVGDPFPRPQDLAYRQYLIGLIAQLKLGDSVILAGHLENVADVYAGADLVVNPARFNEPFGRVPFEAALAGKPAVVTRVGAIPELLRDERSALVVDPDDPAALARAIVRLLADPALGERLVGGARALVETNMLPEHSLAGFKRAVEATERV